MKQKMERRLQLCRRAAYVGIILVLVVYLALSWLSGNLEAVETLPGWSVGLLQFLLGVGSALTVAGIVLGLYYKGRAGGSGSIRKK